MSAASQILAILSAFPVHHTDMLEFPQERNVRLHALADAIVYGARGSRETAAALTALAWFESRLARYVQAGQCELGPVGARCDNGLARSPWQLHRAACPVLWKTDDGAPGTLRIAARCAGRIWKAAGARCVTEGVDAVHGAFSGYGRGASCKWVGSARRVETFHRLLARL